MNNKIGFSYTGKWWINLNNGEKGWYLNEMTSQSSSVALKQFKSWSCLKISNALTTNVIK